MSGTQRTPREPRGQRNARSVRPRHRRIVPTATRDRGGEVRGAAYPRWSLHGTSLGSKAGPPFRVPVAQGRGRYYGKNHAGPADLGEGDPWPSRLRKALDWRTHPLCIGEFSVGGGRKSRAKAQGWTARAQVPATGHAESGGGRLVYGSSGDGRRSRPQQQESPEAVRLFACVPATAVAPVEVETGQAGVSEEAIERPRVCSILNRTKPTPQDASPLRPPLPAAGTRGTAFPLVGRAGQGRAPRARHGARYRLAHRIPRRELAGLVRTY